jgi:NADH:ubiquinone oxidoreductase subunit 5 (subunit L)/multisubunit Na+/H+ antiporter MnhA subunit
LAAFFLFIALSSMGLPMLNGFVGEFLILLGTFQTHANWASWAALGVILSACYLLWAYQRVFFGEVSVEKNRALPDASHREIGILATMAVITLWMGVGSTFFTHRVAASSQNVLDQMQRSGPQEACLSSTGTRACAGVIHIAIEPVAARSPQPLSIVIPGVARDLVLPSRVQSPKAVILRTSDKDVRRTSTSALSTASTATTSRATPGAR